MAIVVEHEKRRREILEKALDVFVEEGFENTSCQKIADRCAITRTTLYIYFRNKREIFNFSIKQFLTEVEEELRRVRKDAGRVYPEKLKATLLYILEKLEENKRLLSVILDYLLYLSKTSPAHQALDIRVRRRTIRLRHILASMVIDGIKAGQIHELDIRAVDDLLYGLIEASIFHLTVLKRPAAGLKDSAALIIDRITIQ